MEITAYHSWRGLIYHLFRTDLLRSIFDLFLSISFDKLFSWCFNNKAIIASLSVAGEHIYRYIAVPLTSYMVFNVNVNVNVDLCFTISCELVGWPTIAQSQALEIVYHTYTGAVEGVVIEEESASCRGAQTKCGLQKRELTNKLVFHSDFSSSCCCIIVGNSPSLMIISSLFSRFLISSSLSWCSVK